MQNLDRLEVYIDNKGGKEQIDIPANSCGSVTRVNDALFKPTIHLQCLKPIQGRFVYIESWGATARWNRLFSAVICEVMVYE